MGALPEVARYINIAILRFPGGIANKLNIIGALPNVANCVKIKIIRFDGGGLKAILI